MEKYNITTKDLHTLIQLSEASAKFTFQKFRKKISKFSLDFCDLCSFLLDKAIYLDGRFNGTGKKNAYILYYLNKFGAEKMKQKKNKELQLTDQILSNLYYVDKNEHMLEFLKKRTTDQEYNIVYMHIWENLTFRQIATNFNLSAAYVNRVYLRVIHKLKRYINDI